MAQIRDIVIHVSSDVASRKRKCHRSKKHSIPGSYLFLSVRESNGLGSKNYCSVCANEILSQAIKKLQDIQAKLNSPN
jgi:hypothetical protein